VSVYPTLNSAPVEPHEPPKFFRTFMGTRFRHVSPCTETGSSCNGPSCHDVLQRTRHLTRTHRGTPLAEPP
jgi:hypothetical protein